MTQQQRHANIVCLKLAIGTVIFMALFFWLAIQAQAQSCGPGSQLVYVCCFSNCECFVAFERDEPFSPLKEKLNDMIFKPKTNQGCGGCHWACRRCGDTCAKQEDEPHADVFPKIIIGKNEKNSTRIP